MRIDQVFLMGSIVFIGGVGSGSFFVFETSVGLLLLAIGIAGYAVFPGKVFGGIGGLLILFFGGVWMADTARSEISAVEHRYGKELSGMVRVLSDPEEKVFFQKTIVRFEECGEASCPNRDILWQAPLGASFEAGQRIRFVCRLEQPENFSSDFDYRMFLWKDGIGFLCQNATVAELLPGNDGRGRLMGLLYRPKRFFEEALSKSIPEPEAGLAKGLLLGGSDYLPHELGESFRRAGLSHIVAVSGYNIALIAQCFLIIGILLGLWRKQALWAALLGIMLFIVMIGAPASAVRAGVMAGIAFAAVQTGRLSRSLPVLIFAAALMLFFNPLLLRYDIGFELSFLAACGIIVASTWQEEFFPETFFGRSLAEILWMTFVVELFVLPILLYQFQAFSPLMLLSNTLLLPLIPYAMALSFFVGMMFLIAPGSQMLFAWIDYFLLSVVTRTAERFGGWSFASIDIGWFGAPMVFLWYAGLFFVIVSIERRRKRKMYAEAFSLS